MKQKSPTVYCLLAAGSLVATGVASAPGRVQNPSGAAAQSLAWTQDVYHSGTWQEMAQEAADCTEGGFTDWRLPTSTELQTALQDGSFGPTTSLNVNYFLIWSATGSKGSGAGSWVYCYRLYTDAGGNPIAPSGTVRVKEYKNGLHPAKFVRP